MHIEITIPSPGESITEALLATWLVADGDFVEKNQELAEIESDKATLPLIASESGRIRQLVKAGDTVKIGAVACTIDTSASIPQKSENLIVKPEIKTDEPSNNIKISPIAQKMMEENNLSVDEVMEGLKRIGKQEVEAVLKYKSRISETKPQATSRFEERKAISPLRKKLSERLVAVKNQTAMLTTFNEVDMTEVMAIRKKYQSQFEAQHGIKIGFMSFFAKAVAQALRLHPNINSMLDGDEIITPNYCDIAIAVQTDKGLMVPVLRNVESLSLAKIEHSIADLAGKARSGRIGIEEMTGGTFTITNGGVFGSLLSTPIINPPQSAILGMHNIVDRPVAINGKVEIRPMMYVALSYDHRIIDGKDSVGFLVHVKQFIENPVRLLFDAGDPEKTLLGL
ncbi:MAG: 2-oxoglutarate dehydrogenase complex dihydrolipoyllysine-residue succinyltransferase [Bacteroidota bacterium]|nr:2-oxoglutarate dehydrogenase complex dihydrolipoyllysine-residue succinyltransferase [Bacteroidota bacterium]